MKWRCDLLVLLCLCPPSKIKVSSLSANRSSEQLFILFLSRIWRPQRCRDRLRIRGSASMLTRRPFVAPPVKPSLSTPSTSKFARTSAFSTPHSGERKTPLRSNSIKSWLTPKTTTPGGSSSSGAKMCPTTPLSTNRQGLKRRLPMEDKDEEGFSQKPVFFCPITFIFILFCYGGFLLNFV